MRALILHLQAPLMSFGGPQVDQIGPTGQFPTLSQITGLFANSLGYAHRDTDRLQALQKRLSCASVLVREGEELQDYQTVDLGQVHLRKPAWTTRGRTEHRDGGPEARYGTHIRFRRYRADASVLTAASLSPADETPTLSQVSEAIVTPARPLFIGRKACLPSTRLLVGIVDDVSSLTDALARVPGVFADRWPAIGGARFEFKAEWPVANERALSPKARLATHRVIDRRDWRNQLHGGERVVAHGTLTLNNADAPAGCGAS